jgi:Fur family ferric uptake transcriptional regulator
MRMKAAIKRKARELLHSVNLRRTSPRVAILAVLLGADRPLAQQQIAAKLGAHRPDRVTTYRTLETFVKAGIVHKAFLQDRKWHFELAHNCTENQCHPHFTCNNCGQTHCLPEMSLPMAKSPRKGFIIRHQQTRFEGLCPECA